MVVVASSLVENLGSHCIRCCYSRCYSVHQVRYNCAVVVDYFRVCTYGLLSDQLGYCCKKNWLKGLPYSVIITLMSALSSNKVLFSRWTWIMSALIFSQGPWEKFLVSSSLFGPQNRLSVIRGFCVGQDSSVSVLIVAACKLRFDWNFA